MTKRTSEAYLAILKKYFRATRLSQYGLRMQDRKKNRVWWASAFNSAGPGLKLLEDINRASIGRRQTTIWL